VSLYRHNCTIHKTSQSQLGETLSIAQASKKGRKRHTEEQKEATALKDLNSIKKSNFHKIIAGNSPKNNFVIFFSVKMRVLSLLLLLKFI
jgi:hypothetical protein